MRLVFAGTPEVALPSLRALLASERHEVVAVVTRPDAPAGRGRHVVRSPVGALADEHGDPIQIVGTGLMSRCVQHETDHLDGVLFLDRLDAAARKDAMKQIRSAEWYDAGRPPTIKTSPHGRGLFGLGR